MDLEFSVIKTTEPTASHSEETPEELQQHPDPLTFCSWIAKRPYLFFGCFLVGHILMPVITGVLVVVGYDILPINFEHVPLDIKDDIDYLRALAWETRGRGDSLVGRVSYGNITLRSVGAEFIDFIFYMEGGNVFTQENLKIIKKVEDSLLTDFNFQNNFCLIHKSGSCRKPLSVLRYFDGTFGPRFYNPSFEEPYKTLYKAATDNSTKVGLQFVLGANSIIDENKAQSSVTHSVLAVGMPLAGYTTTSDRGGEQRTKIETFLNEEFKPKADELLIQIQGDGEMKFVYSSATFLHQGITSQGFYDMALAIGSFVFIVFFVCFQTNSLWVGLFAIFSIITSFLATNLIYRVLLDYRYIGLFHVMAIFLVLGIGADDVFVFYDTWKETGQNEYRSLADRLSYCYRRASSAMLYTSLTTAAAFAVSAASPFLAVSSFGIFSCSLIIVNYVSVVTFFPCVVVTHHLLWRCYKCCCCCRRGTDLVDRRTNRTRQNAIIRFFRGPYYKFVTHKVARWIILMFFTALQCVSIYFITQIEVNDEQEQILAERSNFGKYLKLLSSNFTVNSETSDKVSIVFGFKTQNVDSCHKSDFNCKGDLQWDNDFNLNSAEAQKQLLELCLDLKALSVEETKRMAIKRSLIDDVPEVQCFIEDMSTFYKQQLNRSLPLIKTDVETLMTSNPQIYDRSRLPPDFDRHFEVALSFWLFNGFQQQSGAGFSLPHQLRLYNSYLGEAATNDTVTTQLGLTNYKYGTRLRYAAIIVDTTIEAASYNFKTGLDHRNAWEDYLTQKLSKVPSLRGGFHICTGSVGNVWLWFKVRQAVISSAITGVAIGISLAFPLLVIATQNIILGFLATLTIGFVATSVIAVIPIVGWKLGVLESLNIILVVGLSVDYVVHLAEGYSRSTHCDRKSRARGALQEVGISVLSGAVTTLGSSAFLLGGVILFFPKFGVFVLSTIGFSMIYALGFFITFVGVAGPEGNVGSLKPLWQWCASKCSPRKPSHQ